MHGRKKWAEYYLPENVERQAAFFDRFLRGIDNDVDDWPRVRAEVRTAYGEGEIVDADDWPLPDVEYRELHLDAESGMLQAERPTSESSAEYHGLGDPFDAERLLFEHRFTERTDIVGHSKAVLFMSAAEAEDMDVFVGLFKRDEAGAIVPFAYYAQFEDGPVALGWLRASHRELDEERSTPFLPVLAHQRALPLEDGPTRLEIEILPSGTRFEAGDSLVLVVQGYDIKHYRKPLVHSRHETDINTGPQILHTGGRYDSHLVVPVRRIGA